MSYAVIQLNGKQYTVKPGDSLIVDRVEAEKQLIIPDVLLMSDGKKTIVGDPTITGAKVTAEITAHDKSKKLRVFKYKSKSRYRRTKGHRQLQTRLTIVSIDGGKA